MQRRHMLVGGGAGLLVFGGCIGGDMRRRSCSCERRDLILSLQFILIGG